MSAIEVNKDLRLTCLLDISCEQDGFEIEPAPLLRQKADTLNTD